MNKKTVVIYHRADFDGIFCREIARKFLPESILIGWDYGDPIEDIKNGLNDRDTLYMLDISVDGLMGHPNLIWIDHHKSAMEKYDRTAGSEEGDVATRIDGYRIDGVAACRLAWQWFVRAAVDNTKAYFDNTLPRKQDFVDRNVSEPWAVRLAGEYDIWDKRDADAELFQHGLKSEALDDDDWAALLTMDATGYAERLISQGKCVQYAKAQENESIIKAAGFTVQFEGLTFLACNHARYNSFLFTAGLKPEHDACLGFAWRDGQWVVSLYHAPGKEHHDLSLIAVKHGGGGHRGACGFRVKTLPFLT